MSSQNFIQEDVLSHIKLVTKIKVDKYRAMLSNAYGVDIYNADDLTVSLLHDLALIQSGKSPKVYL